MDYKDLLKILPKWLISFLFLVFVGVFLERTYISEKSFVIAGYEFGSTMKLEEANKKIEGLVTKINNFKKTEFSIKNKKDISQEPLKQIKLKRQVVYARILKFRDKSKNQPKFGKKFVGYPDKNIGISIDLYDEAFYLFSYTLYPHIVNTLLYEVRSSGLTKATGIIPPELDVNFSDYQQSKFRRIESNIQLKNYKNNKYLNYILVALHFYNGYQFNESAKRYESDGGVHIRYPVDELEMIFDFSSLNYKKVIKTEPKFTLYRKTLNKNTIVSSKYINGVLISETIPNLKPGDNVHCDWEWFSE